MGLGRRALIGAVVLAACAPAGAAAASEVKHGIDVSRFNGAINWQRVADSGREFAFIQASRGDGKRCPVVPERCGADETYRFNYREARRAGVKVGPYHRAFPHGRNVTQARLHARAEASVFLARVKRLRGRDLPPALDVEAPLGGLEPRFLRAWLRTWLRRVERRLGTRPVIYTNYSSWQETGDTTSFALRGHHLWVANWHVKEPLVPAADWAGAGWTIWQHSSDGRVPGIRGRVDLNRLRGSYRALRRPLKLHGPSGA